MENAEPKEILETEKSILLFDCIKSFNQYETKKVTLKDIIKIKMYIEETLKDKTKK